MQQLTPRDYQQVGINFLRERQRAMLTDQPGLGKTLQASAAATLPVLVACPTYLVAQWWEFLERQYPDHTVVSASEDMDDLGINPRRLTRDQRLDAIQQRADWTIINTEMLREVKHADGTKSAYKFPAHYRTLIIDESHFLRGHKASSSKRATILARSIPNTFLLTATPIYKEVDDLYQQLRILDPKNFTSYWRFVNAFCLMEADEYMTRIIGANPAPAARAELQRILNHYTLGRTYTDVGMALPPLRETIVRVPLSPDQAITYRELQRSWRSKAGVPLTSASTVLDGLREFTKPIVPLSLGVLDHAHLADTAAHRKRDAIDHVLSASHAPAVIFCWYRDTATSLAYHFTPGQPALSGDLTPRQRLNIANRASGSIVATLASLSEGVDLSRYSTVIYAEEDYVPGRMVQSLARVRRHRHTTSENLTPVNVYYIHLANTVDEVIHYTQAGRALTASEILQRALIES